MDVARDDQELLVVTENGFGKRTPVSEYRKTSRGAKGVQTIKFSEKRGGLAAALVVRPHQELVFISQEGMVQRTSVRGIRQTGRAAQGVTLMNVRDEDRVSAVALVVESDGTTAAAVTDADLAAGPVELSAGSGESEGLAGGADAGSNGGATSVVDFGRTARPATMATPTGAEPDEDDGPRPPTRTSAERACRPLNRCERAPSGARRVRPRRVRTR